MSREEPAALTREEVRSTIREEGRKTRLTIYLGFLLVAAACVGAVYLRLLLFAGN